VRSTLSSPKLRRILIAYTVNRLGNWIGLIALLLAVFDHTHSVLAIAGLTFAWEALPAFVVPALVARVEASQRRGELSGLYFFEGLATASLAVLLWHFSLPPVLLLAALDGTAALTASALLRAQIARSAREQAEATRPTTSPADAGPDDVRLATDELAHEAERNANAALSVAASTSFVLGPAVGGIVAGAAGAPAALFIDVGSFLICGALLLDLRPHVAEAGGDSVRARLTAAWRHINDLPQLRMLLLAEAVALVFFETATPIEVTYVKTALHAGDRGFGILVTVWGGGAVLGSLAFARLVKRTLSGLLCVGTVAVGVGYLGFAAAPSLAVACPAAFVGGIGNGLQWPALISIVQRLTPQHLHGRLMGAVESLRSICLAVGLVLGAALVAISSPRAAFLIVGLGAVATTGALLRTARGGRLSGTHDERGSTPGAASAGALSEPSPTETTAQ
jgi:predicted MFS family arabinose efflux permease